MIHQIDRLCPGMFLLLTCIFFIWFNFFIFCSTNCTLNMYSLHLSSSSVVILPSRNVTTFLNKTRLFQLCLTSLSLRASDVMPAEGFLFLFYFFTEPAALQTDDSNPGLRTQLRAGIDHPFTLPPSHLWSAAPLHSLPDLHEDYSWNACVHPSIHYQILIRGWIAGAAA